MQCLITPKTVGITALDGAATVPKNINASGAGVKAEATVTTTISGLAAGDDGVLSVVAEDGTKDSYDLATYDGDAETLAADLGKAGYDVSYDKDTSVISITAKNVNHKNQIINTKITIIFY